MRTIHIALLAGLSTGSAFAASTFSLQSLNQFIQQSPISSAAMLTKLEAYDRALKPIESSVQRALKDEGTPRGAELKFLRQGIMLEHLDQLEMKWKQEKVSADHPASKKIAGAITEARAFIAKGEFRNVMESTQSTRSQLNFISTSLR